MLQEEGQGIKGAITIMITWAKQEEKPTETEPKGKICILLPTRAQSGTILRGVPNYFNETL